MKYDFTTMLERTGKDAIALEGLDWLFGGEGQVEEGFSLIPMWIADMNFATVPTIVERVKERIEHPAYGYFMPRDEYYDRIINWQKVRNHVEGLTKEAIHYENGVLGGVASAMKLLGTPGDKVLVHAPTYIGFLHTMEDTGFKPVFSELYKDEDGVWRMDYEDMEKKIKANHIHIAIFCSPHNPSGRVWEREEIEKAMEVYKRNNVYVISDEIWSDLTLYNNQHIPTQSVSEDAKNRTIALYAPSKTFNLAGFIGSYRIVYNEFLRDQLDRLEDSMHYNSINLLSMYALLGAYTEEGMQWVDELRETLEGNVDFAYGYIKEHFPGIKVAKPEGTYMLFLDLEEYCKTSGRDLDEIRRKGLSVGVLWQDGREFGGEYTIRINLALPLAKVQEAFDRLDRYVFTDK